MTYYLYSQWDTVQEAFNVHVDDVMDAMAEELAAHGDLMRALRNLAQRGMKGVRGSGFQGLGMITDLLKKRHTELLNRYTLDSILNEPRSHLDEIIQREKMALGIPEPTTDQIIDMPLTTPALVLPSLIHSKTILHTDQCSNIEQEDHLSPLTQGRQDSQQKKSLTFNQYKIFETLSTPRFCECLTILKDYMFSCPESQIKFDILVNDLRNQSICYLVGSIFARIIDLSKNEYENLKSLLRPINIMLDQQIWGEQSNYIDFLEEFADILASTIPQTREELVKHLTHQFAPMQSLLNSLSENLRSELETILICPFSDVQLTAELNKLRSNLDFLSPIERQIYHFSGTEVLQLDMAIQVITELQKIEELQERFSNLKRLDELNDNDAEALTHILGLEWRQEVDKMLILTTLIIQEGYAKQKGDGLILSLKAVRKIGYMLLRQISHRIKLHKNGAHASHRRGFSFEARNESKPYEFGDQFNLDIQQSMFNAIRRTGKTASIRMQLEDFVVFNPEQSGNCSTVLLLDTSRSMGSNGCFEAAKKVALALSSLIKIRYPRDNLHVVGFSEYANEIPYEDIPLTNWGSYYPGTNMHHALIVARRLLARHHDGFRQILMVTDGEPTAHLEQGIAYFNYPPTWRSIEQTLLEVHRCTKEKISINIFMMENDPYLIRFVQEVARINRGRYFLSSSNNLGLDIITDYIKMKER